MTKELEAPERIWMNPRLVGLYAPPEHMRDPADTIEYALVRADVRDYNAGLEAAAKACDRIEGYAAEDCASAIRELLTPLPMVQQDDWQPIATAPRDDTDILLVWADGHQQIDRLSNGEASFWYENTPTHWRLLPPPPVTPSPVEEQDSTKEHDQESG